MLAGGINYMITKTRYASICTTWQLKPSIGITMHCRQFAHCNWNDFFGSVKLYAYISKKNMFYESIVTLTIHRKKYYSAYAKFLVWARPFYPYTTWTWIFGPVRQTSVLSDKFTARFIAYAWILIIIGLAVYLIVAESQSDSYKRSNASACCANNTHELCLHMQDESGREMENYMLYSTSRMFI